MKGVVPELATVTNRGSNLDPATVETGKTHRLRPAGTREIGVRSKDMRAPVIRRERTPSKGLGSKPRRLASTERTDAFATLG